MKRINRKMKERRKRGIVVTNIMCKELFFLKLKKNGVLSEINYLGIFISILSCEIKGRLHYYFSILRSFPFPTFS